MVEDGFRTGEQHIVEAGYLRHSRARPDIPSFLRRLADPVRHEFEKILEAGGQHGLLVERGGRAECARRPPAAYAPRARCRGAAPRRFRSVAGHRRSEEDTSELQSLMRISSAVVRLETYNYNKKTYQTMS